MFTLRPAAERGLTRLDWLESHHSFSFGDYQDPGHMGVSVLRVLNDDTVAPGRGFATHGHRDMEIVTYVLAGALRHRDSMGNGSVIEPGDVQRMSAGTGVRHSEFNASPRDAVHFLQIWFLPNRTGVQPAYAQRHFPVETRRARLALLLSPDGRDGSLAAHQEGLLYGALLEGGERVEHRPDPGRQTYVHLARGAARVGVLSLHAGDGVRVAGEAVVPIEGMDGAEILLFDLP